MSNELTSSTSPSPAKKPAPRRLRPPSSRDLDIYKRVKLKGYEQWEVAQDYQLHYSRVCQIVKRVTRWLAAGGLADDPLIRDYAARQRLSRGMLKLRLSRAIELATMGLEFQGTVETTRRRVCGITEVWREESSRNAPRNSIGALRVIVQATQALRELEDEERDQGTQQDASDEDLLKTVFELLCGWRARAEAAGQIAQAADIRAAVADGLSAVVGSNFVQVCRVTLSRTQESIQSLEAPQAPVPAVQAAFPSAQATFPSAQEPLKLSDPFFNGADINHGSDATSAATEQPTCQNDLLT